uniref:Uncharacterized protein n=1 Tax=Anguilla anguilla TaxID=7936 RepID=A0A0E9QWX3_ANGAN
MHCDRPLNLPPLPSITVSLRCTFASITCGLKTSCCHGNGHSQSSFKTVIIAMYVYRCRLFMIKNTMILIFFLIRW